MEKSISVFFKQIAVVLLLLTSVNIGLFAQAGVTFPNSTDVVLWERSTGAGGNLFNYANMKADIISGLSNGTVTNFVFTNANGFSGSVATATTTPTLTLTTSVNGMIKGNGTAMSAATAGTDYSAGTSALGTGILKSTTTTGALTIAVAGDFPTLNQNTTGTAANVTGTVAVVNGGTGATTLTGLIKGSGTSAFTAAVAGTDYVIPSGSITGNAGTVTTNANMTGDVTSVGNTTTIATGAVTATKLGVASVDLASNKVTGIVPIANGGTGSATQNWVDLSTTQASIAGAKTFTTSLTSSGATTLSGGVTIGGGIVYTQGSQITANTTLVGTDYMREINSTTTITISITTGLTVGKPFKLPLNQASTGSVVINSTGSETFNGNATYTIGANSAGVTLVLDKTSSTNYKVTIMQ